jgi:hypothetical protein
MAVIKSSDVDLNGEAFKELKKIRGGWIMNDVYSNPGPTQFEGDLKYHLFKLLRIRDVEYMENLKNVEVLSEQVKSLCRFGTHADILKVVTSSLNNLEQVITTMKENFKN